MFWWWSEQSQTPPLPSSARQMSHPYWCFLAGDSSLFPVKFDHETATVGELKDKIKEKKPAMLGHIDSNHLTLYRVEIDASDENYISELNGLSLDKLEKLTNPMKRLSEIFAGGPAKTTIHILVEAPQGESIYCGDVALMVDVVDATDTQIGSAHRGVSRWHSN